MSAPASSSPQTAPSGANMLLDYYQQWSMKTPYITRATCLLLLASYLLSLLFRADMSFGNIPFYTLTHFEIYRLLTSPLVGNSLLNIAILLFVFPALSGRMETSISSLGLLFLMGTITLAVNSAFDLICLLLYLSNATPFALFYNCSGFWTIVFALITVDCMHTPDVPRSLFIIQIPGKLYPLVLYGLFSLLGGGNLLSHGISLAFGYLYSLGYLDFLKPTGSYLATYESSTGMFFTLSRSFGWVLSGAALGHAAWLPTTDRPSAPSSSGGRGGRRSGVSTIDSEPSQPPPSSSSASAEPKERDLFPGSGHRLAPTTTASANYSLKSMLGSQEDSKQLHPSREDVAARRLAALSGTSSSLQTNGSTSNASAPPQRIDTNAVVSLMEMGFTHEDASRALSLSDGTLAGALQLLTT